MKKTATTLGMDVRLTSSQRTLLRKWQADSAIVAKISRRARILQLLGDDWTQAEVARSTGAGIATVGRIRRRFFQEGLEKSVFGYTAPGRRKSTTDKDEAQLVALACSAPPAGRSKWTVRLLSEYSGKTAGMACIGRETVRMILNRHGSKPWLKKNVVCSSP